MGGKNPPSASLGLPPISPRQSPNHSRQSQASKVLRTPNLQQKVHLRARDPRNVIFDVAWHSLLCPMAAITLTGACQKGPKSVVHQMCGAVSPGNRPMETSNTRTATNNESCLKTKWFRSKRCTTTRLSKWGERTRADQRECLRQCPC